MADFSVIGGSTTKAESSDISAASSGINLVPSGTAHVKGGFTELLASTGFSYTNLLIGFSSRDNDVAIVDIAIGSAGNEEVILHDLLVDLSTDTSRFDSQSTMLPVSIPAGTRISGRVQAGSTTTNGPAAKFIGFGGSLSESSALSQSNAEGINLGTTRGTQVDPGATVNTKGAYSQLTASSTKDYKGFFLTLDQNGNTAPAAAHFLIDIAIGGAASEQIILPEYWRQSDTDDVPGAHFSPFFPIAIPIGTRIAARAQSTTNDATDRIFNISLNGVS